VSRPEFIHEYKITKDSLYAASSMGFTADRIITYLSKLSKVELDEGCVTLIRKCTDSFGKAKMVLKKSKFYVESTNPELLKTKFLRNDVMKAARVKEDENDNDDVLNLVDDAAKESDANLQFDKVPSFLPSFLPPFLPSFLSSFIGNLPSFLGNLSSFLLPSFLVNLPSFLPW
jgi:DNA excision repair protein ERCC-3